MYLKRMIAHGFKSFADKLVIEFTDGVSGIVGPNGSGKSNVVDAVRWVLGEQSVKSLRGDGTMTDVIFSGSSSRKASNQASITLVFDNSDHYLPVDFTEVSIKRQVYKDGTQEYYFNGEKCRLKDITSILLDTGIAKESFNIISQGKVEEIISSKPQDRRVMFEEAAGVLKYKKRKEDALRKLERTHENMERVEDIILDLKEQVEPLRKQKEQALLYQEKKEALEKIEIAVITKDITDINFEYQKQKEQMEKLNEEIMALTNTNTNHEAVISKYKLDLSKIEQEYHELSKVLLEKTKEVEKINSQKQIILERKKYQVEDTKLHQNLLFLKEEKLQVQNDLLIQKRELDTLTNEISVAEEQVNRIQSVLENTKQKRFTLEQGLSKLLKEELELKNQVEHLQNTIENNSSLPYAVKQVLNNPKLAGIHNAIGSLIEVEEQYSKAISISLGGASSYIVVENEKAAKDAITYLKENNIGRATFFPLNVIKGRYLDETTYHKIKNIEGFIDIAANLVKTNPIYHNIINHHLGSVIVVDHLDTANKISKLIQNSRKIVTLDGDVINIGGSFTGGANKTIRTVIQDKYELEHAMKLQKENEEKRSKIEDQINLLDQQLKGFEDQIYLLKKEQLLRIENRNQKDRNLKQLEEKQEQIESELKGTDYLLTNRLSEEEESILDLYYEKVNEKNELEQQIKEKARVKEQVSSELEEYDFKLRRENSLVNSKNKELMALEIDVNRKDVKLDNLLNILSETYSMTYEKAYENYPLEMDITEARQQVSNLKRIIKEFGIVNLGAIEEYDRVSVRYEFLLKQKDDLLKAEDTLLEIIKEMDEVMKKEWKETFDVINEHFKETFTELFRGGHGELRLTDPDNLLETGVEIVASPPGKKLTSISLLSGGEKTFTAISLLFAILKSRPVPFCILDEVEAALDEANVNSFGKYLTRMKEKTQFILITHKKKTMEYADVLYGITMQESGVSKLVSVKLDEIE